MAAFATPAELAARLGVPPFEGDAEARAETLIEIASGVVQAATGQTIELVTDDELVIRGTRETTLRLPERPIVSVASVTLAGGELDADGYYVDGPDLVRRGGWGCSADELVVTYTHGFAQVPDAVKAAVLEMAARTWTNPSAVVSERLGQAQFTYAAGADAPTGMDLSEAQARRLRRLLSVGSESLPIR